MVLGENRLGYGAGPVLSRGPRATESDRDLFMYIKSFGSSFVDAYHGAQCRSEVFRFSGDNDDLVVLSSLKLNSSKVKTSMNSVMMRPDIAQARFRCASPSLRWKSMFNIFRCNMQPSCRGQSLLGYFHSHFL